MQKNNIIFTIILAIIVVVVILAAGYFLYYKSPSRVQAPTTADWHTYRNTEYGFEITFPDSWKGYTVEVKNWEGHVIDNYQQTYTGPEIIIKNPQTTQTQQWQDIPIMVFTPDVWKMVSGNNPTVAVSAAPIGPAKIGENSKYVLATPPRWYGFTDAIGIDEALNIIKTFKAF